MSIESVLYDGITDGRYHASSERTTAQGIIDWLRPLFPSEAAAARAAGVPRSSWRRWARGARPTPRGFALLQAAQRRVRLPREREAWMRHGHIVVRGKIRFSDDYVKIRRLVTGWPQVPNAPAASQPAGMQGRILDAWLAANDFLAVHELLSVLLDGFNHHAGTEVDAGSVEITSIRWYRTRGEALNAMRLPEPK